MIRTLGLTAAALALWAASAQTIANAYSGGCLKDSQGRCYFAPLSMSTPSGSDADSDAYGDTPDQHFAYWLTHDDFVPEFRIIDFDTVKAQALKACDQRANGMRFWDMEQYLSDTASYTLEVATLIVGKGISIYCPWVIKR